MTNDHLYDAFDSELVLVGAMNDDELVFELQRLVDFLEQAPGVLLEDVAYTCAVSSRGMRSVVALVANSVPELLSRLKTVTPRIRDGAARVRDKSGTYYFRDHLVGPGASGKLAFLFPGAMSYYPDMLRDLAILFPVCRTTFDELEEAMKGFAGFLPSAFIFPPADRYRRDAAGFSAGGYAQGMVSVYTADAALYRLFTALGVKAQGVFGFSGGDLSALAAAGAFGHFKHAQRVRFLREYYHLVDRAVDSSGLEKCEMYSAISPLPGQLGSSLAEFTAGQAAVAFNQSNRQHTVALRGDIAADAVKRFSEAGIRTIRLPVDRPFNTPWCEKIIPEFRRFAKQWINNPLELPLYSCASARPVDCERLRHVRDETAEQWAETIRFDDTVRRMAEDGYRIFLEVGPRGSMCSTIDEVLRGTGCVSIAANRVNRSGLMQLHHALAHLAALGVHVDATFLHARRRRHMLDFDSPLLAVVRADTEMRLSRSLPKVLFSGLPAAPAESLSHVGKAAMRDFALKRRKERRGRDPASGETWPIIHSFDTIEVTPGISIEVKKALGLSELKFLRDCAYGASRVSYGDPELTGLTPLTLAAGAEMMAELARELVPNRVVVRIDDLASRRMMIFSRGALVVNMKAERVSSSDPNLAAVRVHIRDDAPNGEFTWPAMEGTVYLAANALPPVPVVAEELLKPRSVHWSYRDIYPDRLRYGNRLHGIVKADIWSEGGLDYEVEVPSDENTVKDIRRPLWEINPLMLESVIAGFSLWRSHERFGGNFQVPFRIRRLTLYVTSFARHQRLKCYMRLTSVTPKSHICDIKVSDGNGNLLVDLAAVEELTARVPVEYPRMFLSPPSSYLTSPLSGDMVGNPPIKFSGSVVFDLPYPMFEQNGEMWLKILSRVTLCRDERAALAAMTGTVNRRTEWMFGRIAAKEAVRRFLLENYQARWTSADIQVWSDDRGKPHVLGDWAEYIPGRLDVTIAHTAKLVVAAVAANARIGIDVEAVGRDLSDEFTKGVFDESEQALATDTLNSPVALLRFWCAKEAVSKALGTGIRYSPKDIRITAFNPETGTITVELKGQWLEEFKFMTGRPVQVASRIVRDHALSSCFLPQSLFSDGE